MNIKEWLKGVEENNFPSKERQKELGWIDWKCSTNNLDSINTHTKAIIDNLKDDIKNDYDISLYNDYQKENFGGTLTTLYLKADNRRDISITKCDWTMMYRYNIYENGNLIQEIEDKDNLIKWLNENL